MKVSLISLGCPKNQVAAEQMLAALSAAGHEITSDPAEAEAVAGGNRHAARGRGAEKRPP